MKIITLVDSFKGSISSLEIKEILEAKAKNHNIFLKAIPMSDGGEGFLTTIGYIFNKKLKTLTISSFNKNITMPFLIYNNKVYLEAATIVGINLLKAEQLNPYKHKTTALGQVIELFYNKGYKDFVIGLGGTATNDFGLGLIEALGAKFYIKDKVVNDFKIKDLNKLSKIDLSALDKYKNINFQLITDVSNKSFGRKGATKVFSGQKGLNKKHFSSFEKGLKHYTKILIKAGAFNASSLDGSGAAGGLGFIFLSIFNSAIHLGADYILNLLNFKEISQNYDIVITGEGKVDKQSLDGKVVFEVLKQSKTKTIIICGINDLNEKQLKKQYYNLVNILPIVPNITNLEDSIKDKKYFKILIDKLFRYLKKEEGKYYER